MCSVDLSLEIIFTKKEKFFRFFILKSIILDVLIWIKFILFMWFLPRVSYTFFENGYRRLSISEQNLVLQSAKIENNMFIIKHSFVTHLYYCVIYLLYIIVKHVKLFEIILWLHSNMYKIVKLARATFLYIACVRITSLKVSIILKYTWPHAY